MSVIRTPDWRWPLRLAERSRAAGLAFVLLLYAVGVAVHMFLRGHADNLGQPSITADSLERFLFHGVPSLWLQRWTPDGAAINFLAAVLHSSFFFVPLALTLLVFARLGARAAIEIVLLQLLLFFSADAFYALCPTQPPWMDHNVARVIKTVYGDGTAVDDNALAAIPSLHAAIPALLTVWFARQRDARLRGLTPFLALWTVATAWALVYSGEHYLVDVLAGAAWAAAVCALPALRFARSRRNRPLAQPAPARGFLTND